MKLKKGDNVIVKTGKDAGKKGTILRVLREENRVVVEGLNIVKRSMRSRGGKEKSQVIEMPAPIHASNVMIVDAKSGTGSRIGTKKVDGKNVRIAKKSGSEIK